VTSKADHVELMGEKRTQKRVLESDNSKEVCRIAGGKTALAVDTDSKEILGKWEKGISGQLVLEGSYEGGQGWVSGCLAMWLLHNTGGILGHASR
jgi:hypothetical protein